MEIFEGIERAKEQMKVSKEKRQAENYEKILQINSSYNYEIQNFINNIIDKYRWKPEVKNYYMSNNSGNLGPVSQYDTLNVIQEMLEQYERVKFAEDVNKELKNHKEDFNGRK